VKTPNNHGWVTVQIHLLKEGYPIWESLFPEIEAMKSKKGMFNPAFKNLNLRVKASQEARIESDHSHAKKEDDGVKGDNEYFLEAMSDVTPLPGKIRKLPPSPGINVRPPHPAPNDEQEAMECLYALVKGFIEMDITFSDEYMEGSVKGFSRKLMKKLKKGQFPVQDYIDLHGLTKQEAEKRVNHFLLQSCRLGLRCVLIVHGRGLNSPDSFPVLKESLPVWLNRKSIRRIVLAFATAMPYDGGTGAVYVLLRRR
jgi:DNA-nicking Smr family endonuclease